jgi:hypothetical protein
MTEEIKKEETKKFAERNFGLAEFKRNVWHLTLEENETFEDALNSANWSNLVSKIVGHDKSRGPGDLIQVWKPDTGAFGEMIIREVGPGYARADFIRANEPKTIKLDDSNPFITKWNVGKKMHEVLRRADNAVMAGGFQSKAKAFEWIADHMAKTKHAA